MVVVWVDSDPAVEHQMSVLQRAGFETRFFSETRPAMDYLQDRRGAVEAILTSSMKRGGRAERGLPSGMDLADFVTTLYGDSSHKPLLAFITVSADQQEVLERGFTIFVHRDRRRVQEEVVAMLQSSEDRNFRKVRARGLGCGFDQSSLARFAVDQVCPDFSQFHSSFSDLCFCERCEPKRVLWRAGEKYALPTGWFGFGIHIRMDFSDRRCMIEGWHVAYHGTSAAAVPSVLKERRIMFPGDTLQDGTELRVAHGGAWAKRVADDGKVIYVSPTIRYSSHPVYARPLKLKSDGRGVLLAQFVFQCRVKPGTYQKFPETLDGTTGHVDVGVRGEKMFDPEFPDSEVEWVTADRQAVVPYRLLVRVFEADC